MLTEEENKAVTKLKSDYIALQLGYDYTKQDLRDIGKNIGKLLNLVNNLQKENTELQGAIDEQVYWDSTPIERIKENYIPKSEIREKIRDIMIDVVEELLEEEE